MAMQTQILGTGENPMKKATKLLALILAGLMLCLSFVACGGGGGADTADTTASPKGYVSKKNLQEAVTSANTKITA